MMQIGSSSIRPSVEPTRRVPAEPWTGETRLQRRLEGVVISSITPTRHSTEPNIQNPDRLRLLLVDDHRAVAEAFALALENEYDIVGILFDGNLTLPWLETHAVDVVVLDCTLPGCSLFKILREIRRRFPEVFVVGLSMFEKAADWSSLHRYGFHAAVSKASALTDIKSTITEVASRKAPLQDRPVGTTPLAPTVRQLDLLNAFALDLTGKEIASLLGLSEYRVNEHIAELKRKLNIRTRESLVLRAVELGWLEPWVVPMVGRSEPRRSV